VLERSEPIEDLRVIAPERSWISGGPFGPCTAASIRFAMLLSSSAALISASHSAMLTVWPYSGPRRSQGRLCARHEPRAGSRIERRRARGKAPQRSRGRLRARHEFLVARRIADLTSTMT
jgi:hypothetical protein